MNNILRISLITISMALAFAPMFWRLIDFGWRKADYTHAYFILPISIALIWLKRKELKTDDRLSIQGFFLLLAGLVAYVFANFNEFLFLEAVAFVMVVWAIFRLQLTDESFNKICFPLAYLIFLIPPPSIVIDWVTFPLKTISAEGSYWLLKVCQIPVKMYGVILNVNNHELFVADACSGFRSIVTLLSLGAVYIYFQHFSTAQKWIVFFAIVPLAVFANIFRIALTGVLSYKFGPAVAEGFFHETSGLVLFVLTVLGLMAICAWMERKHA